MCENNGPLENASSARGKFEKSPASKFKGIYCLAKGEQRNIQYLRKKKDKAQQTKPFFSSVSGPQRLVPLPAAGVVSTGHCCAPTLTTAGQPRPHSALQLSENTN